MSYRLVRPLLFALPAESAHAFALGVADTVGAGPLRRLYGRHVPARPVEAFGLRFPNPVGLAAGLDKNADHVDALGALGFGFLEVGTVTPRPQPGNPRPRLFRVPARKALINRMGFNNKGVDHAVERLAARRFEGIVGVNIGKNRDTPVEQAVDDYLACLDRVHAVADYVTVNISSPNTPGLRSLQSGAALDGLLGPLTELRGRRDAESGRRVPLLVKIAPDLEDDEIRAIADAVRAHAIDGIIATNTTSDHASVSGLANGDEEGGLSGAPLAEPSTARLRLLAAELGPSIPVIGVGGIVDADTAHAKQQAGARLVQLYTGLIYRGPSLIREAVEAWEEERGQLTADS
ncbi:MAG: quinone-dependent dihydroorotate dehydrogenase [Halofilum sp. (in: g-proteobacteria)]|nr:quinone-dependent dihydroorotate dehydrogenase [Halofilum sp. (in: g-proteobacteria)]